MKFKKGDILVNAYCGTQVIKLLETPSEDFKIHQQSHPQLRNSRYTYRVRVEHIDGPYKGTVVGEYAIGNCYLTKNWPTIVRKTPLKRLNINDVNFKQVTNTKHIQILMNNIKNFFKKFVF